MKWFSNFTGPRQRDLRFAPTGRFTQTRPPRVAKHCGQVNADYFFHHEEHEELEGVLLGLLGSLGSLGLLSLLGYLPRLNSLHSFSAKNLVGHTRKIALYVFNEIDRLVLDFFCPIQGNRLYDFVINRLAKFKGLMEIFR